jgi:uncharacterized protein (DUF2249 family)
MNSDSALDIRGASFHEWDNKIRTLIQVLEPGQSFVLLSDFELVELISKLILDHDKTVQMKVIEKGPVGWKTRIARAHSVKNASRAV